MPYPQISAPATRQVNPITLVAPDGSTLRAEYSDAFTPGRCAVAIGDDAWVGAGVRISAHHVALDTVNGLGVFDLREVQLLRLLE